MSEKLGSDGYLAERRADLDEVGDRIVHNLIGEKPMLVALPEEEVVIVALTFPPQRQRSCSPRGRSGSGHRLRQQDVPHGHPGASTGGSLRGRRGNRRARSPVRET